MNRRNIIKKGGLNDPVAQSIRNEQMQDARPSPDEIARERERHRVQHAELKAVEAFLEHYDSPTSKYVVQCAAELLGFSALQRRADRGHKWRDFKGSHDEPHERSGEPYGPPPTKVDDQLRKLKQEKFLVVQQAIDTIESIRSNRKIMNPFGAQKAWVVVFDYESDTSHRSVFTNDTFERAMDSLEWSSNFETETIEEYQDELRELFFGTVNDW